MSSINRVVLVGRLTKDPELRYTPNGVAVASFSLAVNRPFVKEDSAVKADFPNCVAWKAIAENLANYQRKGSLIGLDGRIQTRNYQNQEGKTIWVTEVVAESIQYLGPKSSSEGNSGGFVDNSNSYGNNNRSNNRGNHNPGRTDNDPFAGGGSFDISDDDLPF